MNVKELIQQLESLPEEIKQMPVFRQDEVWLHDVIEGGAVHDGDEYGVNSLRDIPHIRIQ